MKKKGRAPKKRKLPLRKRVAIALVRSLEESERKKQTKQQASGTRTRAPKKSAGQNKAAALKKPAAQKKPATQKKPKTQKKPAAQKRAQTPDTRRRPPLTPEQQRRRAAYLSKMRRRKRAIQISTASAALLIVILILSRTVLFKIQNIEITNPEEANYTKAQIEMASGIVYGTRNLFSCDLKKVAKNIEQLPYIGKAEVTRDFPKSLRVTVTPTWASAAIAYGAGYLLIDTAGKMLENTETVPDSIPVLRCKTEFEANPGQYIGVPLNGRKADDQTKAAAEMIELYRKIYDAAEAAQIKDITLIDIRDTRAITLMYDNRLTLHLGTQDNLDQKLKSAAKTIAAESDASRTRTGAIDLTNIPYVFSRDTYASDDEEETTDASEPENVTESAQ